VPPKKPLNGILKYLPAAGLLLLKGKSILGALKFLWVAKSGLSILLFVGIEAYLFGWPAAVIITVIILSMSLGRFIALKLQQRKVKALTLIPFIGGGLTAADAGETAAHDAWVGLSGPIASGLLSLSCLGIYAATGYLAGDGAAWPLHYIVPARTSALSKRRYGRDGHLPKAPPPGHHPVGCRRTHKSDCVDSWPDVLDAGNPPLAQPAPKASLLR